MLSATLSGFFAGQIPTSFPPGVSDHVTVRVSSPSGAVKGANVSVSLYLSQTPSLDGDALMLGTATRSVHLRGSQSAAFPFRFASPSALPSGADYLLARVDAPVDGGVNETIVVAPRTVSVALPFVDLVGQIAQEPSRLFVSSTCPTSGQIGVLVFNTGNMAARGPLQITTYASTDSTLDASDTVISVASFSNASVRPGASRMFPVRLSLPAGMPVGNYVLLAPINSSHVIAESNTDNNVAVSPRPVSVLIAPCISHDHNQQDSSQSSVEIDTGSGDAGFVSINDSASGDSTPAPDDGGGGATTDPSSAPAPPDTAPAPPDSAISPPESSGSSTDPGTGGDFSGPSPDDSNAGMDF